MWSLRNWRRRRTLARNPVDDALWAEVRQALPILDGITPKKTGACASAACCSSTTST